MISLPLLKVAIKVVVPIPNASAGIVQSTVPPIGISTVQLLLPLLMPIAAGLLPSLTAMVIIPLLILFVNVIFVIMGNKPPHECYRFHGISYSLSETSILALRYAAMLAAMFCVIMRIH